MCFSWQADSFSIAFSIALDKGKNKKEVAVRSTRLLLTASHCHLRDAVFLAHGFGGEIAVSSSTVPVAFHWFGVEGYIDTEIFGHSVEDVTGHPQIVTHRDTTARSNLEFPLQINQVTLLPALITFKYNRRNNTRKIQLKKNKQSNESSWWRVIKWLDCSTLNILFYSIKWLWCYFEFWWFFGSVLIWWLSWGSDDWLQGKGDVPETA